jgi:hypothetical protein
MKRSRLRRQPTGQPSARRSGEGGPQPPGREQDQLVEYVELLTAEVYRWAIERDDYGRAARHIYRVFVLTGRLAEAAYIQRLLEQPPAAVRRVGGLIQQWQANGSPADGSRDELIGAIDDLIMASLAAEDHRAAGLVDRLLRTRAEIATERTLPDTAARLNPFAADDVNRYLQQMLHAIPSIRGYLSSVADAHGRLPV